jgi:integrase
MQNIYPAGNAERMKVFLTSALVAHEQANPPRRGTTRSLWDTELPGFAARIHPTGGVTFILKCRREGQIRRVKVIGPYGDNIFDLVEFAREQVAELLADGDYRQLSGPAIQEPEGVVPEGAHKHSVDRVAAEFITQHLARRSPGHLRDSKSRLRRFVLPAWSGQDLRSIKRKDVEALLDGIVQMHKPIQANRTLSLLRSLFSWAVAQGLIKTNLAKGIQAPAKERHRGRVLSDQELASVWWAANRLDVWGRLRWWHSPWGPWFKILMLTGQRRSECARMRWQDVNTAEGTWSPTQRKAGHPHLVPLPLQARAVLEDMSERRGGPWVFRTRYGLPLANFSSGKSQLESKLPYPVAPWTINDLHRSAEAGLATLGVRRHVISAILNQSPYGSSRQHEKVRVSEKEKCEALNLWARHLDELAEKHIPPKELWSESIRQEIRATYKPVMTMEEAIADVRAVLSMMRSRR